MSEHAEPTVAGELVVRNGKHSGTVVALRIPVTVIGTADACDVKLTGDGVLDLHCVVAASPAGLAMRSWCPDQTLLNGEPASAALLKDGDELQVGPCRFQVAWHAAPADTPPADEYDVEVVPDDGAEWDLAERERSLHEQEEALAALIDARYQQFCEWFEELADRREELRLYRARQESYVAADKAKVKRMREQTDRLRKAARKDRMRTKAVYARFLKRMKQKWSAERRAVEADRADLDRKRHQLAAEVERFGAEHAQFAAEAAAYKKRLHDAWELLSDGQRRLLADRQEAERTLARQQELLDQRAGQLDEAAKAVEANRLHVEQRAESLLHEVTRLEVRASQARAVLLHLEEKRADLEAGTAPTALGVAPAELFAEPVSLDTLPPGGVMEVYAGLVARDRDMTREKNALALCRMELERRAADLADQRAVLAEQLAALIVARQTWQTAECRTVVELEGLARSLRDREFVANAREQELQYGESILQRQELDLADLRAKLEAWQLALGVHEASSATARDQAEREVNAQRQQLEKWEAALASLCRKWAATGLRDRDELRDEIVRWSEAREAHLAGLAELDRQRDELAREAVRVAEVAMAVQETSQELTGGKRGRLARRKLRVHGKKWASYFGHYLTGLDTRRASLTAETAAADERCRVMARAVLDATERQLAARDAEQTAEAERLARGRELDDRAVILSIEQARAEKSERELAAVRAEVERMTAALMGPNGPPRAVAAPVPLALRAA